jgi:hypothetical protein
MGDISNRLHGQAGGHHHEPCPKGKPRSDFRNPGLLDGPSIKRWFLSLAPSVSFAVLLLGGVCAVSGLATAQTATSSVRYQLNTGSTFEHGCFPPCLCPIMIAPVRGTFFLTPTGVSGLFNTYAVSGVRWTVWINGAAVTVTGSGTYKVGGEFALQQQLSLNLRVGGGSVQHFDSGLVGDSTPFPNIKVTISVNGEVCFDTAFNVIASPVR